MKKKITRRESRKHLEQFNLATELVKVIKHFFPDLINLLKKLKIQEIKVILLIQMLLFS